MFAVAVWMARRTAGGAGAGHPRSGGASARRAASRAGGALLQATAVSTHAARTMILGHHLAPERAGMKEVPIQMRRRTLA